MKKNFIFMKKALFLCILLTSALFLVSFIGFGNQAYATDEMTDFSIKCGSKVNLNYDIDTDTITVSGTGSMYDDYYYGINMAADEGQFIEYYKYCKANAKKVIIEEGVTSVGKWFLEFLSLYKVVISDSVESITELAFGGCTSLASVSFGKNISVIGECAFAYCNELTILRLPENLKRIENEAFMDCTRLRSVVFNDELEYIGNAAFYYSPLSGVIDLPVSVSYIGDYAFNYFVTVIVNNCNCEIGGHALPSIIHGHEGSTAEEYAKREYKFFVHLDEHKHTYKSKTSKKATLNEDGKSIETCTICAKTANKTIYKIKSVELSSTKCTYTGEKKTPTVTVTDSKGNKLKKDTDYTIKYSSSSRKSIGNYNVKITFKGKYSGSKTLTFQITPGKVTGVKQDKNKKGLYVYWSKVTKATGYEIWEYSNGDWRKLTETKESFKYNDSVTASYTNMYGPVKWKIRAYTNVDGKKIYGSFSDVKTFYGVG